MTENSDKTYERGATLHSACECCEHAAEEIERLQAHIAVLEREVKHLHECNETRLERNRRQGDRIVALYDGLVVAFDNLDELVNWHYGGEWPVADDKLEALERARALLSSEKIPEASQPLDGTAKLT